MPEGSGDVQGTQPVGCGPFKFVRREFGNEVELVRFDEYWDGAPYLDGVLSREVTEPTVRLTGLETGEFHLINDIPLDRVDAFLVEKARIAVNNVDLSDGAQFLDKEYGLRTALDFEEKKSQ